MIAPAADTTRHGANGRIIALGFAVAAAIFVFDLSLPLGVAGGVPYVALVLVGLWSCRPGDVLILTAAATVLTGSRS
jgi:hypothetical protein